jgi:hypothetical protein
MQLFTQCARASQNHDDREADGPLIVCWLGGLKANA